MRGHIGTVEWARWLVRHVGVQACWRVAGSTRGQGGRWDGGGLASGSAHEHVNTRY